MRAYGLAWRQRPELGRVRPVGRRVGQGCGACQRSLVRCGAGSWRRRTACPGRRLAGPTGWVCPPAVLNVTVPPGLMVTWAGCHWLAGVPSISSLGLAWPRAPPGRSGRPVVRGEAVASPAGVSCLEVEVDGLYGLASDDLCVCRLSAREGSDPEGVVGRAPG